MPFYFCPRSVMLYLIHQANYPELEYRGGQQSIVNLQADLKAAVDWASCKEAKQAEFLMEGHFPWAFIEFCWCL